MRQFSPIVIWSNEAAIPCNEVLDITVSVAIGEFMKEKYSSGAKSSENRRALSPDWFNEISEMETWL